MKSWRARGSNPRHALISFLLANALERLVVRFLIHELPGSAITLGEVAGYWVEDLRTLSNSADAMSVAFGWIGCHDVDQDGCDFLV